MKEFDSLFLKKKGKKWILTVDNNQKHKEGTLLWISSLDHKWKLIMRVKTQLNATQS